MPKIIDQGKNTQWLINDHKRLLAENTQLKQELEEVRRKPGMVDVSTQTEDLPVKKTSIWERFINFYTKDEQELEARVEINPIVSNINK